MKYILSLFLILSCLITHAQSTFNLNDCMTYAVENNFQSQRAKRNVETARKEYIAAIGKHLPSLSGSIGANTNFGRGIDPETNTYISTTSFNNSYGVSASIPLFSGFELVYNTLKAKTEIERYKSELQKAKDDVALDVMSCFIDVIYNQGLVSLTEKRIETFTTDLQRTERMSELGTKSAADVAQFASTLASEELTLITRQNLLNTSILELKKAMNYPIEDTLKLSIETPTLQYNFNKASDIFNSAMNYLPEVDILNKKIKAERYKLSIARSNYYPYLSTSGGYSTNYYTMLSDQNNSGNHLNFWQQFKENKGFYVSFGLSIPIFQGLSTRMTVQKAKIAYRQAQSDYQENLRTLKILIEQAVMDMETAGESIEAAMKSVDASDLAHRAAQRKYEEGLLSVIELQTTSNQLLLSQVELLSARLRYEVKSRQVAYFSGEPIIK